VRELCLVTAAAWAASSCIRPVATARTSPAEPPATEEIEAGVTVDHRACSPSLGFLFPGVGQLCLRQTGRGAVLASLAAAEIGTAVAVGVDAGTADHPGVALPLAAVQDLWVYGVADVLLTRQLAARELYVPRDTPTDLVAAPLNLEVMKRPAVWAGLALALATGLGVSIAISDEEDFDPDRAGDDPDLFGERVDAAYGYPLGFAAGAGLFSHVAIAEEALFRGYVQSSMARARGETIGWVGASLLFGAAHVPNAFALEEDDRAPYLLYGLPIITATGFYLGWLYRESDYSLAPPTAVHFWYDFLLTSTLFVLDPENSLFSARVAFPF
jgi:membrane protease YdiL (CAAX protease family)